MSFRLKTVLGIAAIEALVLLILVINLLGDWVRDYLNPKLYKG